MCYNLTPKSCADRAFSTAYMCKCCSVVSLLAKAEERHVQAQETLVLEVLVLYLLVTLVLVNHLFIKNKGSKANICYWFKIAFLMKEFKGSTHWVIPHQLHTLCSLVETSDLSKRAEQGVSTIKWIWKMDININYLFFSNFESSVLPCSCHHVGFLEPEVKIFWRTDKSGN